MKTRREFLKHSATTGALISTPYIWTSSYARAHDLNSKLKVAAIGVGGSRGRYNQGGHIARRAAELGTMVAVCDVDDLHTAEFNNDLGGKLNMYRDYRELLEKEKPEVVTVGTPDHWHVPISIAALRAGADVYCEKPLTLTIQEGIDISKVVEETGRVFQVGTQQRSSNENRFLKAIAIVQSGRLGKNVNAYVAIGGAPGEGPFQSTAVPEGLDWEMWVGPAPAAEYSEERRKMFRWWYEYSGGKMTDWGAHHIDIAQWALGHDHSGPVEVSASGKFPPIVPDHFNWDAYLDGDISLPSGYNTVTEFSIDLKYENGAVMSVNSHYKREGGIDFENGILFEGDAGRIFVNRGKLEGKPVDNLSEKDNAELETRITKLYKGKKPGHHMRNFFECIEDREQPISDVFTHHRTMTSCHLCNIALMLGRDLKWDPKQQTFVGDDQANALKSRKSREVKA
ncbi:MAG: Gfo/Idh/MocA family oxidoreductase [Planctomycetes bacterium]|nr:Gfo/Idh/MocA family oxidoreductase [Planctomycetota bacterium]